MWNDSYFVNSSMFSRTKKNTDMVEVGDPMTLKRLIGVEEKKGETKSFCFFFFFFLKAPVSCCYYYLSPVSPIACALAKSHYMIILILWRTALTCYSLQAHDALVFSEYIFHGYRKTLSPACRPRFEKNSSFAIFPFE